MTRVVYVLGHSADAIHGLDRGLLESEYFAAVAAPAGVISAPIAPLLPPVAQVWAFPQHSRLEGPPKHQEYGTGG